MADLLGFTSIAVVCLLTLLLSIRWPEVSKILFVALIIRIIFLLIGQYVTPLPDSTRDAITFHNAATQWSEKGFSYVMDQFNGPDARFISWLIAILYSLLDRSILMAKCISLLFGMGSVLLSWLLAIKIWNKHIAKKVGWVVALFPSLVLYSVITMREAYMVFFLLVALFGVVDWVKKENLKSIFIAIIGFVCATFFHGGMFVGAIVFLGFVGISSLKKFFKLFLNNRISLNSIFLICMIVICGSYYLSNKISVPYLGSFESSIDIQNLLNKTNIATRGVAGWPEWTIIHTPIEFLYKAPIRSLYIIFSPFPWDISRAKHLIGMFDAFLYMYLSILIFKNLKYIWKDKVLKIILIILLSYIFVFGIGVGNFGTGIRHRSKFTVLFILLSAPLLKKFKFLKQKKDLDNLKNIKI